MALSNVKAGDSVMSTGDGKPMIGDQQSTIAECTDGLDGATLTGSALTTSATPTVDELEAAVGVLGGKVNAILQALAAHGFIADA
jgi:hypothetical protein